MITEQDALLFQNALDSGAYDKDTDTLEAVTQKLDEYRQQEESAGRQPFAGYLKQQADQAKAVANYFTNPDTLGFEQSSPQLAQLNQATRYSADPRADKMTTANVAWLSHQTGASPEAVTARYPFLRDNFAAQVYGHDGGISDEQFYNRTGQYIADQKDEAKLFDSLSSDAGQHGLVGAVRGDNPATSFSQWALEHFEDPGFDFDKAGQYQDAYLAQHRAAYVQAKSNLPQAQQLYNVLARQQGLESPTPEQKASAEQDFQNALQALQGATAYERQQYIYPVLREIAKGQGSGDINAEKAWYNKWGDAISRGTLDVTQSHRILTDTVLDAAKQALPTLRADPNSPNPAQDAVMRATVQAGNEMLGMDPGGYSAMLNNQTTRPLTPEEQQQAADIIQSARVRNNIAREVRGLAENDVNPSYGTNWASRSILSAGRMAPLVPLSLAEGPAGVALNAVVMGEQAKSQIVQQNPQFAEEHPEQANLIAGTSGLAQAALMKANASLVMGKLPVLSGLFKPLEDQGAVAFASRLLGRTALASGEGAVIGKAQEMATPLAQMTVGALSKDVPDVDWNKELSSLGKITGEGGWLETGLSMIPLVLLGTGHASLVDRSQGIRLTQDTNSLRLLGYNDTQIAAIQKAGNDAVAAIQKSPDWRLKSDQNIQQAAYEARVKAMEAAYGDRSPEIQQQAAQEQASAAQNATSAHASPEAAKVTAQADGSFRVDYPNGKGGMTFPDMDSAQAHWLAYMQGEAGRYSDEARALMNFHQQNGESWRDFNVTDKNASQADFPISPEQALERARLASLHTGQNYDGLTPAMIPVLAENHAEMRGDLYHAVVNIFHGASPLDISEDMAESWLGRAMHHDPDMLYSTIAQLRDYEAKSGEKLLPDGDVTQDQVVEAFGQLARSHFINQAGEKDSAVPEPVRKTLNSLAVMNVEAFRRAEGLRKMQAEGALDPDLEAALEKSTGVSTRQVVEAKAAREIDEIAKSVNSPISEGSPSADLGGPAFAIASPAHVKDVVKALQDRAKDPDFRRKLYELAADRVARIGKEYEVGVERTKGDIEREAKYRQQWHSAEGLQSRGIEAQNFAWSKDARDYEQLQRYQESKHLLEQQGLSEDEAAKLADASSGQWRLNHDKLADEVAAEAAEKADAWKAQELKDATSPAAQRRRMLSSIATMEAITSVLPPELRGKLGSMATLASITTNEGRARELLARVGKVEKYLEPYLQKEYTGQMERLLDKAEPKGGAGDKPAGKIGVAGHRWFDQVRASMLLSPDEARQSIDGIEAKISDPDAEMSDAERAKLMEQWGILNAFGGWEEKSSAEMASAIKQAQDVYTKGRETWGAIMEQRSAERKALREKAVEEVGGSAVSAERQKAIKADAEKGQRGKLLDFFTNKHLSFAQRLGTIFGPKSETAAHYEEAVTKAYASKQQRMIERRVSLRDELLSTFGVKSWGEAQDKLLALQQMQERTGIMKLEGRRMERVRLPLETAMRLLSGEGDPAQFGLGKSEMAQIKDWVDAHLVINSDPDLKADTKTVVPLDVERSAGVPSEQRLSQLQALHLSMLARNETYRRALDYHGWTDDTLQQIEGFLSPEAKRIRQYLFEQYEKGYEPLNKVFSEMSGVDLPKIKDYTPGYFETDAKPSEMDPFATGVDAGGMAAGFLKGRRNHLAEPAIKDALQVYWQHAMQTEHWKAFAPLVSEMRAVFGNVDVRHAIEARAGLDASRDIGSWVDHIEKNGVRDAQSNAWIGRIIQASTRAGLAFNVGTWMKHLPNAFASLAEVPAGEWMKSFGRVMGGKADATLKELWSSPMIQNRIAMSFAPDLRQVMQGASAKPSKVGDFLDWGTARIPWVASAFSTFSAAIAHDYYKREALAAGLTPEQASHVAMERAELALARTAQPESIDRKSLAEIERTGAGKMLMLFHTPERQQYGVALSAMLNAFGGKTDKGEAMRRVFSTWVLSPVLMQTMVGLARYLWTDDDAEHAWDWRRYVAAVATGPLSGVFGLGQLAEVAAHALHVPGAFGAKGDPLAEAFGRLFSGGSGLLKWVKDEGEFSIGDVEKFAASLGQVMAGFTDLPVESVEVIDRLLKQLFGMGSNITSGKPADQDHKKRK